MTEHTPSNQQTKPLYGYCPACWAPGVSRERRPNGNDVCENGCEYPSAEALKELPKPRLDEMLRQFPTPWRPENGDSNYRTRIHDDKEKFLVDFYQGANRLDRSMMLCSGIVAAVNSYHAMQAVVTAAEEAMEPLGRSVSYDAMAAYVKLRAALAAVRGTQTEE